MPALKDFSDTINTYVVAVFVYNIFLSKICKEDKVFKQHLDKANILLLNLFFSSIKKKWTNPLYQT